MTTALLLLAAACGFTAAAAGSTHRLLDEPPRWALVATVAVGVAAAASATTHATGWAGTDLGWRVVVAVIAVVAGAYASPVLLALVCAALAAAAGGGAAVAVAAAAGSQMATVATRRRSPLLGAAAGAAAVSAALRLERPEEPVLVAALGCAAIAVVVGGGVARMPRRRSVLGGLATGVVAVAAVAALGAASAASARPLLEEGTRLANTALADARQGDVGAARLGLERAAASLRSGGATLDPWWARPARALPVVGANLDVAVTMADVGGELAVLGAGTLAAADLDLAIDGGKVPVDELAALRTPLRRSRDALRDAEAALAHRSTWLVPALASRRDQLGDRVTTARRDAEVASLAAERLPEMFGGTQTRRYLLAVVNPAELRGSGGIVGSVAVVTAEGGRLRLEPVGKPDDLDRDGAAGRELRGPSDYVARYGRFEPQAFWQNVTMSPDFPTVGGVLADQYAQTGRTPVDGVIAVDPTALAALLAVVGPVEVAGLPEPLSADNAERELLHEHYARFPTEGDDTERIDFLGNATGQVWGRLTNTALPAPPRLASALGPAVAGRHLQVTSFHAEDQVLLDRVGITGRVAPVAGDFLGVVTQNAGANKVDWFLDRRYHYDVRLDPATGRAEATLDIELENRSPSSGLPAHVIGPNLPMSRPTEPGDNRLFLSIYTPWEMTGATLGGEPLLLESAEELDRRVYSALLDIPAGTAAEVRVTLRGRYAGAPGYQLDVLRQPTVRPDEMTMNVTLQGGARITETAGGLERSGRAATAAFPVDQARRLELAYEG